MESCIAKSSDKINTWKGVLNWIIELNEYPDVYQQ
jgi:hypothetical protein